MGKNKILIITCLDKEIDSVNSINENLIKSYREKFICEVVELENTNNNSPLLSNYNELFNKLKTSTPDKIIVTHPAVYKSYFFLTLIKTLARNEVNYVFHLYGDFIRKSRQWFALEEYLIDKKILFIAPSLVYKEVISKFLLEKSSVSVVPFAINENAFFYSKDERIQIRTRMGLKDDDKLLIYTGRISTQKNIPLISNFFSGLNQKKTKLLIIGSTDDFEGGTVGESVPLGTNYQVMNEIEKNSNVIWLENIPGSELYKYLSAADLYLSFSLFHDEDFGCAPVEALMTGTPALLTSWGGYKAYYSPEFVHLIDVQFKDKKFTMDVESSDEFIESLTNINRLECTQFYKNKYSITAVSDLLYKTLNTNFHSFKGFNQSNYILSKKVKNYFYSKNILVEENYIKIYKPFWELNEN
ncbi:MAG: glycosyltransferase family 4 protein [Rhizobacter sp.]|nr:glycosyltransferase family 4 protein [Bacteriovorax sp.]